MFNLFYCLINTMINKHYLICNYTEYKENSLVLNIVCNEMRDGLEDMVGSL